MRILRDLPKWNYNNAVLIETKTIKGVTRDLYKLPDLAHIHNIDSPTYFYHYRPKTEQKRGILISYPVLGSDMIRNKDGLLEFKCVVSHSVAWFAAKVMGLHGILVVTNNQIIFNPEYSAHDIKLELENILLNHLQVHDFLKNSKFFTNMNFDKVHHVGASLGALTATMICGATQWYSSLTAVVGGAPLPEILAYSKENLVRHYFDGAMWNFDKTKEQLISEIEKEINGLDTEEMAKKLDPSKVYLILALFDDSVPNNILKKNEPDTGFKLRDLIGRASTDVYPTGHKSIGWALPIWLPKMVMHINKHGGA